MMLNSKFKSLGYSHSCIALFNFASVTVTVQGSFLGAEKDNVKSVSLTNSTGLEHGLEKLNLGSESDNSKPNSEAAPSSSKLTGKLSDPPQKSPPRL